MEVRNLPSFVKIRDEVHAAVRNYRPVVALESTIITHGMPHPQNLEMAERVEEIVRSEGAIPATIAVFEGELRVGLDDRERAALAAEEKPLKLSRADLAHAIAIGKSGGTTVAATMIAAHLAGIEALTYPPT
jgi:pseudouridine-5'-phosphate glycosidase